MDRNGAPDSKAPTQDQAAPILKQIQVNAVDGVPDTFTSIPADHYLPSRSLSVFGGQIIGQAIQATYPTVPEGLVIHSFHGSFIDRTDPAVPITYKVTRLRTGNNISPCLTEAFQKGRLVFMATMSFHKFDSSPVLKGNTPIPTEFPKLEQMAPVKRSDYYQMIFKDGLKENDEVLLAALKVKHSLPKKSVPGDPLKWNGFVWRGGNAQAANTVFQYLRVNGVLPNHPKHGAAAFAMTSDAFSTQLPAVLLPQKNWLAVKNVASVADGGRALVEMRYWNEDGELVATVLQEVIPGALSEGFVSWKAKAKVVSETSMCILGNVIPTERGEDV
ncbi:hypothetical protein ABW19_dt0204712 [Dactylella cylindrospora]|nr:hypothetical protein ABW19_dt0204712 [Dactylella cylindrospora]